jgi:tRNA pseudouridine55 synthase
MHNNKKEGVLLINKPKGITSHDVVDIVRRRLRIRRVGHAGTLDPLAEGLLIILVGRYTKLFSRFVNFDKEYSGVMKLGEVTTTGDSQGDIVKRNSFSDIGEDKIREVFLSFTGEIQQVPPMVSALRVGGRRLYNLARRGIVVERPPRKVTIHSLRILRIDIPYIEFSVHCSKGTYVRKLAEDIGESLSCGAHMVKILRRSIGPFALNEAITVDDIHEGHLRHIAI